MGTAPAFFLAQLGPNSTDVRNYFQVFARLKPGVMLERAKAALAVSTATLRDRFPTALGPKDRDGHLFKSAKTLR
jgi:hypothetical protein